MIVKKTILAQAMLLSFFKAIDTPPAEYTESCRLQHQRRIHTAQHQSKLSMKRSHQRPKRKDDKTKQKEGVNYGPSQL